MSQSLSVLKYMLSHTHQEKEKHIVNEHILSITLWLQQLRWLCAWSSGRCLAAQLCDFSTCSSVWSKWVNSWDLTILKTIAYWSSFLWQILCCNLTEWCFAIFLSFCLMKRILKFNQRVFIISSNSFYSKKAYYYISKLSGKTWQIRFLVDIF